MKSIQCDRDFLKTKLSIYDADFDQLRSQNEVLKTEVAVLLELRAQIEDKKDAISTLKALHRMNMESMHGGFAVAEGGPGCDCNKNQQEIIEQNKREPLIIVQTDMKESLSEFIRQAIVKQFSADNPDCFSSIIQNLTQVMEKEEAGNWICIIGVQKRFNTKVRYQAGKYFRASIGCIEMILFKPASR